nr:hypothetical protein [Kibdelosporangium sp. MJ126-NF4]CEL13435.1 Ornithine cyclodeaminase [Kibdelosporangium sp. MJ126-NF4]CTQ99124.1 Ornithine cyclodeaminase (EC 4.3.1.12) [Kibdelosporangium sp. MJ126-NF4]
MLTITADDTARALAFDTLIPALREGFRRGAHTPDRHTHSLDENSGASLLLMPSWSDDAYLGVKLVTIFPGNNALGRPALSSAYILSSATTGEHLAVLDGDELTRRRTTATSVLAASYLARPDSEVLLVVGAGHIGRMLPAAYRSRFDLHTVLVHDTDPAAAQRLADTLRANGLGTEVVTDLATATARRHHQLRHPGHHTDHPRRVAAPRHPPRPHRQLPAAHARGRRRLPPTVHRVHRHPDRAGGIR